VDDLRHRRVIVIELEGASPPLVGITESSSTATGRQYLKWALQAEAARLLPSHKVTMCCKMIQEGKHDVPVLFNQTTKHAHYGNLCVCGKLWVCPVCASRITEKRANAIANGLRRTRATPILVTFTLQHHTGKALSDTLESLVYAYGQMTSGRTWNGFMAYTGWITAIRALEVTYGQNGWHPHLHILAFMDKPQHGDDVAHLEMSLSTMWQQHLCKIGAFADKQHGVDVQTTYRDVADYVAKFGRQPTQGWTIERELTKSPVKVARAGGFTPFALLEESSNGNVWSGRRFIEYAGAMVNKAQLYIPTNAKELLHLGDESDDQLASPETIDDVERMLARLTRDQWTIILQKNARHSLLEVASSGNAELVERELLTILRQT
jgi:Replication protein